MDNRIVRHKTVIGCKSDACSLNFTLEWLIRNTNLTQWLIGKLEFFMVNKESKILLCPVRNQKKFL
jgi:hypothetical protein